MSFLVMLKRAIEQAALLQLKERVTIGKVSRNILETNYSKYTANL